MKKFRTGRSSPVSIYWRLLRLTLFSLLSRSVTSSSSPEMYDVVRDVTSSGVHQMHDSIHTESTTLSERSSTSRICRRNLRNCLPKPFRSSASSVSSTVSSRTHEREDSTSFQSLTNAVSEEFRLKRHNLLYNFVVLRSDWNLAYANYEQAVMNHIDSLPAFFSWNLPGGLADILWTILNARRQLTLNFGGYGADINRHLIREKLPLLINNLAEHAKSELKLAMEQIDGNNPNSMDPVEPTFCVLKQLLEVEVNDKMYSHLIEPLLPIVERVSATLPNAAFVDLIRFRSAQIPPSHLEFPTWKMLWNEISVPRPDLEWLNYQMRAEIEHAEFLHEWPRESRDQTCYTFFRHIAQINLQFISYDHQGRIINRLLKPKELSLEDFKTLEELNEMRSSFISDISERLLHIFEHIQQLPLYLLALVIQSISTPSSRQAIKVLRGQADSEHASLGVAPYLTTAEAFQTLPTESTRDMEMITRLRPNSIQTSVESPRYLVPDVPSSARTSSLGEDELENSSDWEGWESIQQPEPRK